MINNRESLLIKPFTYPCNARVELPGSKSISNRSLILSVMTDSEVVLTNILDSEDVNLMQNALKKLGIHIKKEKNLLKINGTGGVIPNKKGTINVGNAGTIARFLTCLLASQKNGEYFMDGTEAMRKRPMRELLESLQKQGADIQYNKEYGHFPYLLKPNGFSDNIINIDARKSGQNITGMLMQCPKIANECIIKYEGGTVSVPFVEMTLKMMREFSENNQLKYNLGDKSITLSNCRFRSKRFTYNIEPDATAASYYSTLPLVVGGACQVIGLKRDMLQGDIQYCDVINKVGGMVNFDSYGLRAQSMNALKGGSFDFVDISDTFLTLAAISPLLDSPLEIYGIEHTRKQETDRVSAMARELTKLGQEIVEKPDRLLITPDLNKLKRAVGNGISIDTYGDHRFAMSFAILGCYDLFRNGHPWLTINDPSCCNKTFPGFFDCLDKAYSASHE